MSSLDSEYSICNGRPPHGGRGLKCKHTNDKIINGRSPSPRRAWIEITPDVSYVDSSYRRPPHGGRGLKYRIFVETYIHDIRRPPHGGRGLKSSLSILVPVVAGRPPHGGRGLKL